ncbi:MAG TPA: sll0787 family AIR synthase-like protein [Desulfurivibrionaceae bacterium]|nr:sll0787 family AIR synthase-like protein [Desulfurivibrionaceae bacterium]
MTIAAQLSTAPNWKDSQQQALDILVRELRDLPEIQAKAAIRWAAAANPDFAALSLEQRYALPGDDCAAFKTGSGYQLLAMEGMLPAFVRQDPKAAGWSSVMVNVSDIAAMGGRATALVNAYWHHSDQDSQALLQQIRRACDIFGVAFAGGHSSIAPDYTPGLAVAVTGHANQLLSCHHLKPGQRLFMLADLTGGWHGEQPYWACIRGKSPEQIRDQWEVPARLAEAGLVAAAKDISNGGILGTLIMMLELTGCGARIDLSAIPRPRGDLLRWLRAFQSYGFLLSIEPDRVSALLRYFQTSHLTCQPIGTVTDDGRVFLDHAGSQAQFWDLHQQPLTHMGASDAQR